MVGLFGFGVAPELVPGDSAVVAEGFNDPDTTLSATTGGGGFGGPGGFGGDAVVAASEVDISLPGQDVKSQIVRSFRRLFDLVHQWLSD